MVYLGALDRLAGTMTGSLANGNISRERSGLTSYAWKTKRYLTLGSLKRWVTLGNCRKKKRQRQAEGIEVARASGVTFGRPRQQIDETFVKVYEKWKAGQPERLSRGKAPRPRRSRFLCLALHPARSLKAYITVELLKRDRNQIFVF